MDVFRVLQPGPLSMLQDLGRPGHAHLGVPVAGAADALSHRLANVLVGNDPTAATIEITYGGLELVALAPCVVAITGADLDCNLPQAMSCFVRAGQRITFAQARVGLRGYLAVAGGFDAPQVMGSRSTYVAAGLGGLHGRALRQDDVLQLDDVVAASLDLMQLAGVCGSVPAHPARAVLRVCPGPHQHLLGSAACAVLTNQTWHAHAHSNRMGLRLAEAPVALKHGHSLPSLGVFPGVVQVPPDGSPIVLLADAQTTGGYPVIGVVIQADLPLAAQLRPGDAFHFVWVDEAQARAAWFAQAALVDRVGCEVLAHSDSQGW